MRASTEQVFPCVQTNWPDDPANKPTEPPKPGKEKNVVWTADSRDPKGRPVKDKGSATYSAAIESCVWKDTSDEIPPFAQRVVRELTRRGFFLAKRQIFMDDGAPWIWNIKVKCQ